MCTFKTNETPQQTLPQKKPFLITEFNELYMISWNVILEAQWVTYSESFNVSNGQISGLI